MAKWIWMNEQEEVCCSPSSGYHHHSLPVIHSFHSLLEVSSYLPQPHRHKECFWRLCEKIDQNLAANPWYWKKDILIGNVPPKKKSVLKSQKEMMKNRWFNSSVCTSFRVVATFDDPIWLHICALAEHGFWEAISPYAQMLFFYDN